MKRSSKGTNLSLLPSLLIITHHQQKLKEEKEEHTRHTAQPSAWRSYLVYWSSAKLWKTLARRAKSVWHLFTHWSNRSCGSVFWKNDYFSMFCNPNGSMQSRILNGCSTVQRSTSIEWVWKGSSQREDILIGLWASFLDMFIIGDLDSKATPLQLVPCLFFVVPFDVQVQMKKIRTVISGQNSYSLVWSLSLSSVSYSINAWTHICFFCSLFSCTHDDIFICLCRSDRQSPTCPKETTASIMNNRSGEVIHELKPNVH